MDIELEPTLEVVPGQPDVVAFQADIGFSRDTKALEEGDVEYEKYKDQLSEGDLLIAGWGANFELDRQDEAFAEGAFQESIKSFLAGEATLAYHHKMDQILGKVLDAEHVDGKGVRIVARVDRQPESSPLRHIYEQVQKKTLNALSCGGFFTRAMVEGKRRIVKADLTEWSITGVPVGRGCNFSVLGAKALVADIEIPEVPELDEEIRQSDLDNINYLLSEISTHFDRLNGITAQRNTD